MGSGGYYYESEPRPVYTRPPPAVIHQSSHRTQHNHHVRTSSTYVVNIEGPGPRYDSPSPTRVVVVEKRRREPEPPSGLWAWFCASCCCCLVCCNESCCPYRDYD